MTQCDRILKHLQEIGPITQGEAKDRYGVARLASRVNDLRKDGYPIRTKMVPVRNRFEEVVYIARYHLEDVDAQAN